MRSGTLCIEAISCWTSVPLSVASFLSPPSLFFYLFIFLSPGGLPVSFLHKHINSGSAAAELAEPLKAASDGRFEGVALVKVVAMVTSPGATFFFN